MVLNKVLENKMATTMIEKDKTMKAILVIDKPENCYSCRFCQDIHGSCYCCGCGDTWYKHQLEDEEMSSKPDWCPLKPIPEKKNSQWILFENKEDEYHIGWNDCIDEILGEEK